MDKYNTYKDSGVEWLGEIPEHWEMKKVKFISEIFNGDSLNESLKKKYESDDLKHLAYISSKDINVNNSVITYDNGLRIPTDNIKLKVAPKYSSLLCIEGGSAGRKIAFTNQSVCFVNKLACFSIKNGNNSQYLFFTLKGSPFQTQFKLSMSGMIGGVTISSINNFSIPFPPLKEQTAIAQFLDDKTKKIDEAITIKEQQINLLKERKQILIHKAVTRGLDDTVKLKNSGVEWIGEIPEGWEVARIKQCSNKISKGTTPSTEGRDILAEGKVRFLKSENIFEGFITEKPLFFIDEKTDFIMKRSSLEVDDVLFVIAGASLGKVAVITDEILPANTNQAVAFVRPNKKIHVYFLAKYLISSTINELTWLEAVQSAQPNLSMESLGNFPITLPPLSEQKEISEYIETTSQKIETAIHLKQQEIEKLKEYKSSLINGVVTGKVRVC
uniref:restriction endonuclease subunit S n=1 Tax=Mariniflexile sp. TaxID=1979402 RepID=UPI0040474B80